ncbi:phosphotransferase [Arthrobacter castelli]|uniref:phosphotransferase n=1 Tax=Arthrobacter castelli TaxID=271431 RepID=UPI0004029311|nr:phosphotransferase [Arthrobacter castelli]
MNQTVRTRRFIEPTQPAARAELPSGDVTDGVVRIGNTVRRPHQPTSFAVGAYLDHLERVGFTASPRYLGQDAQGRDVLTFLEGDVATKDPQPWVLTEALLASVARLTRDLHDASAGYDPSGEPFPVRPVRQDPFELVTHLDITPENVVVRDGQAVGLIDFDLAGPSTCFIDSFNTAMHWVKLKDPADLRGAWSGVDQLSRLRLFADAYGWLDHERRRLPDFGAERACLSWERMKHNAQNRGGGWATMWSEGVGDVILRRRTWLLANADAIRSALLD